MKLAIHCGTVLTPEQEIPDCTVLIEDERIAAVGREIDVPSAARRVEARDRICVPGFIDIHVHGGAGHDAMEAGAAALEALGRMLAGHGATSYYPTTLTASVEAMIGAVRPLGEYVNRGKTPPSSDLQAQPLGIHMEGPFLNPKRPGVHPPDRILPPQAELFDTFCDASGGSLRLMTMATEVEGGEDVARHAFQRGVRIGLGHTDATFEEAERAAELGVRHVVHMFNAMRPFSHRDPGVVAAAMIDDSISTELIADGVHVAQPVIRMLLRAKGPAGILLVTDGLAATGMPEGTYMLAGMEIIVKGGEARNRAGVLAGSVLTLDRAVRNMVKFTGLALKDVVRMATLNQAQLMGLERKGRIEAGADADLVLLTAGLEVAAVCARGVFQQFC